MGENYYFYAMTKRMFGPLLLLLLPIIISAFCMKPKTYIYIDGNNNKYTITKDSLDYKPVGEEESSSGKYSGGKPRKVKITAEQYKKIEGLLQAVRNDKDHHIKDRNMGCGTLIAGKKVIYISSQSKHKSELEAELNLCLFSI
ncbi:MAG: hypothetical protein AB1458_02415 [Bacteroidota bacterium]